MSGEFGADMTYQGLIHRYGQYLDLPAHTKNISLLEGNTPLIIRNISGTRIAFKL